MARGERLADRGDLAGAVRSFGQAVALDPACFPARLYQACLRILAGEHAQAERDLDALAGADHSRLAAYRDLQTLSPDQFPEFLPRLEAFLARRPHPWAHVVRAFSLRLLLRTVEAVGEMDRAVLLAPGSAALLAIRSRVKLVGDGRAYDGLADVERALALAPRWGWLHCWRGEALRHAGRPAEALAALDRGLELDPSYRLGLAWRGGALAALGRWRRADRDLTRFLRWDPVFHGAYDSDHTASQNAWVFNQRMLARRGAGRTLEALEDLRRAHALESRYGWCYNPRGEPAVLEAALAELDAALRRRPRSRWARAWRGHTLLRAGRPREAVGELERAARGGGLGWAWAWLGQAWLELGLAERARAALDQAVELAPSYAPAWGARARLLLSSGAPRAAAEDFTRAIALDYRAAWAYAGRGECLLRSGRAGEAVADLDRALAIYPSYGDASRLRAAALQEAGA